MTATGRSRSRIRLKRVFVWLLASIMIAFAAIVASLFVLARGGETPYVWRPPPTPVVDSQGPGSFQVVVTPDNSAIDAPISITIDGLEPGAPSLVIMSTADARGVEFESWASFVADEQGRLSLDDAAPENGTYSGASGVGLLWSMRAPDGSLFHTSVSWEDREYRLKVVSNNRQAEVTFTRRYPFADVTHKAVGGSRWKGELTAPISGGPFPVIITLGGWDDGPMRLTSSLLAKRGFGVLNLGYHGWEGLPKELVEIPLEGAADAIDWLATEAIVDSERIGIFGISRGAELALVLASRDSRITKVVAWAPSSEVFAGVSFRSIRQRSSWTVDGKPLPFARAPINRATLQVSANLLLRRPTSFRPTYEAALDASDGSSAILASRVNGDVLLVAGEKDLVWPSAEMARRISARADTPDSRVGVTELVFEDAGHSLRFSLWPAGDFTERQLIRGGAPEASHLAGQQAWKETLAFFDWAEETTTH